MITRYTPHAYLREVGHSIYGMCDIGQDPAGRFVLHDDHLAAIAAKDAEIARLRGEVRMDFRIRTTLRRALEDYARAMSNDRTTFGKTELAFIVDAARELDRQAALPPAPLRDGETGGGA